MRGEAAGAVDRSIQTLPRNKGSKSNTRKNQSSLDYNQLISLWVGAFTGFRTLPKWAGMSSLTSWLTPSPEPACTCCVPSPNTAPPRSSSLPIYSSRFCSLFLLLSPLSFSLLPRPPTFVPALREAGVQEKSPTFHMRKMSLKGDKISPRS